MILLFTAIFSTISIIEDRREGFLQSVLVAPVSRMAIVLGKVLGGTVLAFGQGLIFLLLAPTVGIQLHARLGLLALAMMLHRLVRADRTGLLHRLADELDAGLSRDHEPVPDADVVSVRRAVSARGRDFAPLRWVMQLNPLTYGLAALQRALYWGQAAVVASVPGFAPQPDDQRAVRGRDVL